MDPRYLKIVDALVLLALFAGAPAISAVVGYAAWKGRPSGFDRERYALSFVASGAAAMFLMMYAQRMADVRTAQYYLQLACFLLGVFLFGIAGGCVFGVFLYRRGEKPPE